MIRPQIVIHVQNGVVQNIFSSDRHADVIVVDWGVDIATPLMSNSVIVELNRKTVVANLTDFPPRPLHELAGSDLERAVEAAFDQGILAEPAC